MTKKHLQQMTRTKAALKILMDKIENTTDYFELQEEINIFSSKLFNIANTKNNRPNKYVLGMCEYYEEHGKIKRNDIEKLKAQAVKKSASKGRTFRDYLPEYQILRDKGFSYKKLEEYSRQYFKIEVSGESIRKALKNA